MWLPICVLVAGGVVLAIVADKVAGLLERKAREKVNGKRDKNGRF